MVAKKVIVKINELLKKYDISSISQLSDLTGVRRAALSELSNGKRDNINFYT